MYWAGLQEESAIAQTKASVPANQHCPVVVNIEKSFINYIDIYKQLNKLTEILASQKVFSTVKYFTPASCKASFYFLFAKVVVIAT
jgi:hypothetical protein